LQRGFNFFEIGTPLSHPVCIYDKIYVMKMNLGVHVIQCLKTTFYFIMSINYFNLTKKPYFLNYNLKYELTEISIICFKAINAK
jgi:hypothetical protein